MKARYIIQTTDINLIPCKSKKEMSVKLRFLKDRCPNIEVYNQREFKEEYGKEFI